MKGTDPVQLQGEYQVINEESVSQMPELRNSNEEITSLKQDLHQRNLDLVLANKDLANLISNIDVPMIVLDENLHIRFLTPRARELLCLEQSDVGRPITELESPVVFPGLQEMVLNAITNLTTKEQNIGDSLGVLHCVRVRPYITEANVAEGAVLTLMDIDDLKRQTTESRAYPEMIAETIRESIFVLDKDFQVLSANTAFLETFKVSQSEIENRFLHELGGGRWNIPHLLHTLAEILPKKTELRNFEVSYNLPGIGERALVLSARQVRSGKNSRQSILLVVDDITEQKQAIDELRKQSELLHLAHDAIISRDMDSVILFWNRGAQETY